MLNISRLPAHAILILIWAGFLLAAFIPSCSPEVKSPPKTITVGATPNELNTLLYVSGQQGYLRQNGVEIKYKDFDTGALAVESLLKADVDLAMTMEYVTVAKVLQRQDVVHLATIDRAFVFYLAARKDRGIASIKDLKGKNVGLPRQTIMEFFLGRTLVLNGLRIQDVTITDTSVPNTPGAISAGAVDAVVAYEPNVTKISREMGDRVNIWSVQNYQTCFWSMVSTRGWVNAHGALLQNLFKSLAQAETYVAGHDQDTKTGIQKRLGYDDAYVNAVWPRNQFALSVDQSLITAMEDEARWMISNNMTADKQVPNLLNSVNEGPLKSVKPEAISLIR